MNNNIYLETLKVILKDMKCEEVWIDDYIYGLDKEAGILTVYGDNSILDILPQQFHNKLFNAKDLAKVTKDISLIKIEDSINGCFIITDDKESCVFYPPMYSKMYRVFVNAKQCLQSTNGCIPDVHINNFHKTKEYQEYFKLKAADGIYKINANGFNLTLYGKFIPANKKDRVDLYIFDLDKNDGYFYAIYNIHKSKTQITTFLIYIK